MTDGCPGELEVEGPEAGEGPPEGLDPVSEAAAPTRRKLSRLIWRPEYPELLKRRDPELLAKAAISVESCARLGLRKLKRNQETLEAELIQELWLHFERKADVLRFDLPIEPFLVESARRMAMALAKKLLPLSESISRDDESMPGAMFDASEEGTWHEADYSTAYHVPDDLDEKGLTSPNPHALHRQMERRRAMQAIFGES